MKSTSLLAALAFAGLIPTVRAQSSALSFASTSYVSSSQSLQTPAPFTDRDRCSPAANYSGPVFYGAVVSTSGSGVVDLWQLFHDATNGDGPRFRLSATSPAGSSAAAVFLWNRDDFAAGYQDVDVQLNTSSSALSFTGQLFGSATAKTVRFVVQDGSGAYFITQGTWAIPSTVGPVTLSNPSAQTWDTYDPKTDTIGATATPDLGRIFEAGVRLAITKSNGTSTLTVQLNAFSVTAATVTNADSVMGLTARAVSESRVALAWAANAAATKYVVHRSTTTGFTPGPATLLNEVSINAFQDYRLTAATNYYYRVGWVDATGATTYSGEIQAMTNNPEGAVARHPSLHYTAKEVSELAARITASPWLDWYASRKTVANSNLTSDPSTFDPSATGFVACDARGDIAVALALVWQLDSDATLKANCLTALKNFLANMPTDKSTEITPKNADGSLPNPYRYPSALSVSYGARGYALAYDIVYPALTPSERSTYAENLRLHALLLNDSTYIEPSSGKNVSIASQHNNWVLVMGGGLAMTGAALRDDVVSGTNWGQTYLQTAATHLTRAIDPTAAPLGPQIKGDGAYVEGETYSALAGYWASEGLQALRSVNYGSTDLFKSAPYQRWLKYRLRSFAPAGNTALFEAARESSSDSQRWVTAYLHEIAGDAVSQTQLQWLRDVYLTANTEMSSAIFRYPRGTPLGQPVPGTSYVDPAGGLAFFRSANPTNTTSDDANSLVLAYSNKPYPGTIVDYRDTTKTIPLTHFRSGAASFELWAYGAHAVNEPGYYTGLDATEVGHGDWATLDAESHNNVKLATYSPHRYVATEGFNYWSVGHKIECVSGLVRRPFIPDSAYNGKTANPTLPSPAGSLVRTLVFVRPTNPVSFDGGYFIAFDSVTTTSAASTVNWYLHGGPQSALLSSPDPSSNLTFPSGQTALWSNIVPEVGTTNVNLSVKQAVPHVAGSEFAGDQRKSFHEYWTGSTVSDTSSNQRFRSDFTYATKTGATSYQFQSVFFPYTGATAPAYSDITIGSTVCGTTINASSKFAITQPTNTLVTNNGVKSDGLNFYVRKATSSTLDCYFAEESSTLVTDPTPSFGFLTSGSPATLLNAIVVDRYDATARKLRGTVVYTNVTSAFDLTLKDAALPASGGTLTVTIQQGATFATPSITCSSGQVVIKALPVNGTSPVYQFDFEVAY